MELLVFGDMNFCYLIYDNQYFRVILLETKGKSMNISVSFMNYFSIIK